MNTHRGKGVCHALLIVALSALSPSAAPGTSTADRQIVLLTPAGTILMPPGTHFVPLSDATFQAQPLADALTAAGIDSIFQAFPHSPGPDLLGYDDDQQPVYGHEYSGFFVVEVPDTVSRDSLLQSIRGIAGVISAEPNSPVVPDVCTLAPTDNGYSTQWYFSDPYNPLDDMGAEGAWCIAQGNPDVPIALLDGGIPHNPLHSDLQGRVFGDNTAADQGSSPWYNHGLRVAGLVVASSSVVGHPWAIAGMNWYSPIWSRRIDNTSADLQVESIQIASAVRDGAAHSSIVNFSAHSAYNDIVKRLAWADAYKANVITVASAGNKRSQQQPDSAWVPAAFEQGVLAVGASTRSEWPNSPGATWFSNCGPFVDVLAPGDEQAGITSLSSDAPGYSNVGGGTSWSAGMVSGLAGLLKGYAPWLYNDDIEHLIQHSGQYRLNGQHARTNCAGWGLARADTALGFLRPPYTLHHVRTDVGGSAPDSVDQNETFYGVEGLEAGVVYAAKRYTVTKVVTFPITTALDAWGRGALNATRGARPDPEYLGTGWCEVVPGSLTGSGCTLRTYVYRVGGLWVPTDPEHVVFAYTVLGTVPSGQVPPAAVTDVGADAVTNHEAWIGWTEVGGDGDAGQAKQFDLRVSRNPLTSEAAWSAAQDNIQGPAKATGQLELIKWPYNLDANTTYYCAVKVQDYEENWSGLSNCGQFRTLRVGGGGMSASYVPWAVAGSGAQTTTYEESARCDRFSIRWTASPDTSRLAILCWTDTTACQGPADFMSVTAGANGSDTALVSTATATLGLALRGIGASLTFGPTWSPVTLNPYVRRAGDASAWATVGATLHCADSAIAMSPLSPMPSEWHPGDSLVIAYVPAGVGADSLSDVWVIAEGDSAQNPLAKARPEPGLGGAQRPAGLAMYVDWAHSAKGGAVVHLSLPAKMYTRLEVFDVQGRRVRNLANRVMTAGDYVIDWDGRGDSASQLPAGIYLCRVSAGNQHLARKLILRPAR